MCLRGQGVHRTSRCLPLDFTVHLTCSKVIVFKQNSPRSHYIVPAFESAGRRNWAKQQISGFVDITEVKWELRLNRNKERKEMKIKQKAVTLGKEFPDV